MEHPVKQKIDNTELVNDFHAEGGRIMHMRPTKWLPRVFTVAYILKSGRIEFATAVTHKNDNFTKKVGTKLAIEHFKAGQVARLPLDLRGRHPADAVRFMFRAVG